MKVMHAFWVVHMITTLFLNLINIVVINHKSGYLNVKAGYFRVRADHGEIYRGNKEQLFWGEVKSKLLPKDAP